MKKVKILVTCIMSLVFLAACGQRPTDQALFTIGVVTDEGGVNDKSFNQSAWEGLQLFGDQNNLKKGVDYKYLESNSASDYTINLNTFAQNHYNLVFGVGFLLAEDIRKAATEYPAIRFSLIDTDITYNDESERLQNVTPVLFKEEQGSFLVGVLAALHSKTKKVGFIGGMDFPVINRFENGFKAGVKSVDPSMEVIVRYGKSFNSAEQGVTLASSIYSDGADIIFHASGGTGVGIFNEAINRTKAAGGDASKKVWVIGVDRDQYEEGKPDKENVTLTSMVKRVDIAVQDIAKKAKNGELTDGTAHLYGLEKNGVGISDSTQNLTAEDWQSKVDQFRKQIIEGKIQVPATNDEYVEFLKTLNL